MASSWLTVPTRPERAVQVVARMNKQTCSPGVGAATRKLGLITCWIIVLACACACGHQSVRSRGRRYDSPLTGIKFSIWMRFNDQWRLSAGGKWHLKSIVRCEEKIRVVQK